MQSCQLGHLQSIQRSVPMPSVLLSEPRRLTMSGSQLGVSSHKYCSNIQREYMLYKDTTEWLPAVCAY